MRKLHLVQKKDRLGIYCYQVEDDGTRVPVEVLLEVIDEHDDQIEAQHFLYPNN